MYLRSLAVSTFMIVSTVLSAKAEAVLVMVEEQGCMWCARLNEDIADIYPKTREGRAAPLKRIDIHSSRPKGITLKRKLTFTPTFVLVVDGIETSRIEGYPGEDFFWGLLGQMLKQANVDISG